MSGEALNDNPEITPMRILIATVTAGAGHVQAAAALEETWRTLRPKDAVQRLDVLSFTPRLYRKVYVDGYVKIVEHAPELYAHVFKKTDNPALVQKLTRFRHTVARLTTNKFVAQLRKFKPEAVLCTHYLPLEILAHLRAHRKQALAPMTVSIVTDFEAHALWMEAGVDLYCVAAEETKAPLVARGASSDGVIVTGLPISAKFSAPVDAGEARKRMALPEDLPILLVLSGGFGLGPVAEILHEIDKLPMTLQVLVVCGRNEELRGKLALRDA